MGSQIIRITIFIRQEVSTNKVLVSCLLSDNPEVKKQILITATIALAIATIGCRNNNSNTEAAAPETEEIAYADPTIVFENGKYYLTGTSAEDGFFMLESDDLETWKEVDNGLGGRILQLGNGTYGEHAFWAPQVYKENGKYYLTVV